MNTKQTKGKGGNFDTRPNPFDGRQNSHIAPELADISHLGSIIDKLCVSGCAILVGHTRDGGALVVTVLDGDNRHRTYCSNAEELESAFQALNDMYTVD